MPNTIEINGKLIGSGEPVYIIAEISANHNQSYEDAAQLVRLAKEVGADAVKLQTYTPETITIDCDNEYFQIGEGTLWSGKTLYELYSEAYMPWEWQPKLKELADVLEIDLFSTPFDETAVEFLEVMNVSAFKIASFEIVDLPLLRRVAATEKPIIMSTGMATLAEIDEAVEVIKLERDHQLALLKCTSAYPALPEEMNLQTIPHMAAAFHVPVGLSDHTLNSAVPVAAVTLGASIIEKHLTLSRDNPGPDSKFSMEPPEFKAMVNAIRITEKALGQVSYKVTKREFNSRIFRRSLFVVEDVAQGQKFTIENVRSIRPGYGLHTRFLEMVLGRQAVEEISKGTPLGWDLIV
jgi:N-acetylneuraminate synthase